MFFYKINSLIYYLISVVVCVNFIVSCVAIEVLAPVGRYCNQDSDCFEQLICVNEKCKCKPRQVQQDIYCFEEAQYGELCWFDDQCVDHRQICSNNSSGPRRCICDMYHEYNESITGCWPKVNLTSILEEKYNTFAELSGNAEKSFYGILIVGFGVTIVGLFCCIFATVYCYRIYSTDKKLEKDVNALIVKKGGKPTSFVTSRTQSQRNRQMNEAALTPVIETDMMMA